MHAVPVQPARHWKTLHVSACALPWYSACLDLYPMQPRDRRGTRCAESAHVVFPYDHHPNLTTRGVPKKVVLTPAFIFATKSRGLPEPFVALLEAIGTELFDLPESKICSRKRYTAASTKPTESTTTSEVDAIAMTGKSKERSGLRAG